MGLLDDAIKDHLELKRRHGADPGEVARLEHEALGPARREPIEAAANDEPEPELAHDGDGFDEVPAGERLEPPARERDADLTIAFDPDDAQPASQAGTSEPEPPASRAQDTVVDQPTRQFSVDELHDAAEPRRAQPEPAAAAEPVEDDIVPADEEAEDDLVPADEEPDPDDVLEETPEFLQETPEHDRLWFEQKPPKDFDF